MGRNINDDWTLFQIRCTYRDGGVTTRVINILQQQSMQMDVMQKYLVQLFPE
jgi:hypothetical protein